MSGAETARLEALIQHMDGAVLFESEGGEVLVVNQRLCDIFRLPLMPAQLLGQEAAPLHDALAQRMDAPEEFNRSRTACLRSQTPVSGARMACRTGRILERDFAPVWLDGQCAGFLWVYRDVTSPVRMLQRLQESEACLAGLLATTADPMWSLDRDLRLQAFNDNFVRLCEANWGWIPIPGQGLSALADPEQRRRFSTLFRRSLDGELIHDEWTPPAQSKRSFEVRIAPIVVPGDGIVGVAGHLHDISSRRAAEKVIMRARVSAEDDAEAKTRFLASVSHEIRTPLDAVLGLTEIAREEARHPRVRSLLDAVRDNATALRGLVDDTLAFSRRTSPGNWADDVLQRRNLPDRPTPASPPPEPEPEPQGLTRPGRILVVEDTNDSAVVVQASLRAAGHHPERAADGETAVRMAADGTWDLILMDIDLPGISGLEATEQIRAAETEGERVPILALTAHATPDARARAEEVGMQAFLVKPIARPELRKAVLTHATLAPRVWVVDDDADSRRLLEHYLVRDGCLVSAFEAGWDALQAHGVQPAPDVMLLDVELPDMRGPDVAVALRAAGMTCPILALSAHSDAEPQQEALEAGCDRWLDKPIAGPTLRASLAEALQSTSQPVVDDDQLDDDIADLRPLFIEDRWRDVERLGSMVNQGQWRAVQRVGHSIKGTSAPYGFPRLGEIGKALEAAAQAEHVEGVVEQVDAMRQFLEHHAPKAAVS